MAISFSFRDAVEATSPTQDATRSSSPRLTDVTKTAARPTPKIPPVRSRTTSAVVAAAVVAIVLMMLAAVLHTQLAERQFQIDQLNRSVRTEQARFAVLRSERAELRSPNRLAQSARALGMSPAQPTEFLSVEPMELAKVIAAGGALPTEAQQVTHINPLGQFLKVKIVRNEP